MAQQKMQAIRRTCGTTQKFADWENNSESTKSVQENTFGASSNDLEVSSIDRGNSNHRCAILTFFVVEPDGHWRIVALPMQCPDHTIHRGSGSQVKMDGLHLVSPSVVTPVRVDQQKLRTGDTTEVSCSFKPFVARGFSGPTFQYQSRNKGWADKGKRLNALPANSSCHTSVNGNDSVRSPVSSSAMNSSDSLIDTPQVDKAVKKNSKKKRKKKVKGNKKLSSNTAAFDQEGISGSSTSKTAISKNTVYGIEQRATKLTVSSPELSGNGNDSEGNSSGTVNHSGTPKTYTPYVDEVDVLEANFLGEHPLSSSKNGFQMLERGLQDTHSKPHSSFNNSCSCVSSKADDSSMFDSFSVGSYSDESINSVSPVQSSKKDSGETDLLEPPGYIAKNVCCSHGNMLNGVADAYFHAEGTTTRGQRCASGDITMRSKQSKKDPRSSSYSCLSSIGKFQGRSGKENNHSVWQKVQRNDNDECKCGLRKVSSSDSQSGIGLKEVPLLKKSSNVAQSVALSICEDNSQSKLKASKKLKRITTPASKQELKYYSRKGSYSTNVPVNNIQQNEVLAMKVKLGGLKGLNGDSRYFSKIHYPSIGFQTNRVRSITSEPVHGLEGCYNELKPVENVCATPSGLSDQTAKSDSGLLSGLCDHQEQTVLLEGESTGLLHRPGGEEVNKIDKDFSPAEHRKQDYSSGSILQKWIPTGIKHSEIAKSSDSSSLQSDNLNKPTVVSCNQANTARKMASDPDAFSSSVNTSVLCTVQHSRDDNGLHSEDDVEIEKHRNQSTCTLKESCVNHAAPKCSSCDPKDQSTSFVENDSNKIAQAVNNAHTVKLASEAVQMATGCPIAEFERLLYSASPVVCLPGNILRCETCFSDEVVNVPLCRHETPNFSLGSLWQWYEKHGTYGLEVRAEDYENSKRLGIDCFAFRAYFVPFLSAVQLFRNCKRCPSNSSKRISVTEPMKACNMEESSKNSTNIGGLPIFSVLVPQPHTPDTSTLSPKNCACCSETSSVCVEGNATIQPDDSELLFEYFEVEQPQQRRPLFEMIKELVRGDGPSQYRAYGDPTKLDSVALDDLHPASWYSVAWYPIYRIPDGNFRAAFLTYHSLGHLVNSSAISDSGVGACVVSPVVGLQSYNAQGECWFRLRQSALKQTTETLNLNPLRVLKERLRTLEQTASCMARAVVTKGNLTCVNRQPDYEFFLSRQGR